MDCPVQAGILGGVSTNAHLTAKGAATRARIVEAAAELVLERGVGGTSLDDIGAGASASRGQLFHYFPGGKRELVGAIAEFQLQRVLEAQRPYLDSLATWEEWDLWRNAVITHYASQPHWGCPIGTLASELAGQDPQLGAELAGHLERWRGYLEAGIQRMLQAGALAPGTDPHRAGLGLFAALQGGLLLTQTYESVEPLQAALDMALAGMRSAANPA